VKNLASCRDVAFQSLLEAVLLVHQLEIQTRRLADEVNGSLGIFDTRELDEDPVTGLRPDVRLRDSELIDPVPDGLKGLIGRHLENLGFFLLDEREKVSPALLIPCAGLQFEVRIGCSHKGFEFLGLLIRSEDQLDSVDPSSLQVQNPDLVFPQIRLQIFHDPFQIAFGRLLHLNFKDQVHSSLKVQAQMNLVLGQNPRPPGRELLGHGRNQEHKCNNHHCCGYARAPAKSFHYGLLLRRHSCVDTDSSLLRIPATEPRETFTLILGAISMVTTSSATPVISP
jgi:hypothetical protein